MFMNPTNYYHTALMNAFINALIEDKESLYYDKTVIQATEDILNNHVSFRIDEDDIIYEIVDGVETEVFTKDWKNEDAIYAIKVLLSEYPEDAVEEQEDTE